MKTKKLAKLFYVGLSVVLCLSISACENTYPERDKNTSSSDDTDISTSSSAPYSAPEEPNEEIYERLPESEFEQETTYYHAALCGAVIIEQDGSERFTYVKKCENCGTVQSGNSTINATGGVLHGSFMCSKCQTTQEFEIETSKNW